MTITNNNNAFTEKRRHLIESLKNRPELDSKVVEAMGKIPREIFVSQSFLNSSYEDTALPIDCGQTISQPYTVAYMTSMLGINPGDKILEIGTGSGYQACLLYLLGARVFTIERIKQLFEKSNSMFKDMGFNINTRLGDGTIGWKDFAPYKGILVTAAAPEIPKALMEQLETGGRLIVPIGEKSVQTMYLVDRKSATEYRYTTTEKFKFVPLIGKEGWQLD